MAEGTETTVPTPPVAPPSPPAAPAPPRADVVVSDGLRHAYEQADRDHQAQLRQLEETNRTREALRAEFDDSDVAAVHRQADAAERDMRGPHPTGGNTPGDPLKGPSS